MSVEFVAKKLSTASLLSMDIVDLVEREVEVVNAMPEFRAAQRGTAVGGRMNDWLIELAKQKTGIESHTALIEAALVHLVMHDDFGARLVSRKGSINPDLDLEF